MSFMHHYNATVTEHCSCFAALLISAYMINLVWTCYLYQREEFSDISCEIQ